MSVIIILIRNRCQVNKLIVALMMFTSIHKHAYIVASFVSKYIRKA